MMNWYRLALHRSMRLWWYQYRPRYRSYREHSDWKPSLNCLDYSDVRPNWQRGGHSCSSQTGGRRHRCLPRRKMDCSGCSLPDRSNHQHNLRHHPSQCLQHIGYRCFTSHLPKQSKLLPMTAPNRLRPESGIWYK